MCYLQRLFCHAAHSLICQLIRFRPHVGIRPKSAVAAPKSFILLLTGDVKVHGLMYYYQHFADIHEIQYVDTFHERVLPCENYNLAHHFYMCLGNFHYGTNLNGL